MDFLHASERHSLSVDDCDVGHNRLAATFQVREIRGETHENACTLIHTHTSTYVYTHTHAYVHTDMYVHTYTRKHMWVFMCVCECVYVHAYTHTHTHKHKCAFMYVCVCVCTSRCVALKATHRDASTRARVFTHALARVFMHVYTPCCLLEFSVLVFV